MEDYEYYHVDPYNPLDPDREIDTVREALAAFSPAYQKAESLISQLFTPIGEVKHPRCMMPLKAAVVGGVPLLRCETKADLEGTLLRYPR